MSFPYLDTVLGNPGPITALKAAVEAHRLSHAVLLCAPDGCGRNYTARCLAADYLFPNGGPGAEAVMRGESSEALQVSGEGKSGQIPIGRIREARREVFLSALSAAGRAVHIRDAHYMAGPAANALLKVLEEPPADVLFILTAQSPEALPATIASRCARYTLSPFSHAECEAFLRRRIPNMPDETLPALLAVLYDGRCGRGLAALRDENRLAAVQDALAAAKAAAARDEYALLCLFARYEGRAEGDRERREALLEDLCDALEANLRGFFAPGLAALPPAAAALLLPPVSNARAALRANAAPKIIFTALALQLASAGL